MHYRLLVWDFDGTLAHTGPDVWTSLTYAAARCGGTIPESIRATPHNVGKPLNEIFHSIVPFPGEDAWENFEDDVRIHYRTLTTYPETFLYPGISTLLAETQHCGTSHVIVTMKPVAALERILTLKGWAPYFSGWMTPDSVPGEERSKSDMIAQVLKKSGFTPEECLCIGDTWSDITAAHAHGIDSVGVTYGDGDTELLRAANPTFCVDSVDALTHILKKGQ